MNANETAREMVIKIPADLTQHRNALDASLFYLALGASACETIPTGNCKSARIKVSRSALTYLERLTGRFGSQRQAIINALAWAAAQDVSRRAMLETTVI